MRKHAANFEGTAYLVEYNADYEHRENYSMGDGMYLGRNTSTAVGRLRKSLSTTLKSS